MILAEARDRAALDFAKLDGLIPVVALFARSGEVRIASTAAPSRALRASTGREA